MGDGNFLVGSFLESNPDSCWWLSRFVQKILNWSASFLAAGYFIVKIPRQITRWADNRLYASGRSDFRSLFLSF
jgi:hypothetical protein